VISKVLVADDELLIRWAISEALKREGHETKIVEDGAKALESMEKEEFDFVVTDLFMPGTDGWAVLERARTAYPCMKVIIITARGSRETEEKAREMGAYGYVEKPDIIDGIKTLVKGEPWPRIPAVRGLNRS
jgi:two-component system nitrogen regulation response regulator GlnG